MRMKLDPYLIPLTKYNQKKIKNLNIKTRNHTIPRRKNILATLFFFFDLIPKAQPTKAKINKGDYIELKSFYTAKGTNQQNEKATCRMDKNTFKPSI